MAIKIEPLTADRLEDLQELLLPFWQRNWEKSFADQMFRWRFLERPDWEANIAYDNGKPVAFLDSFFRRRLVGPRLVRVRETADWYSVAAYRPLLGVMLMRQMMAADEPMLVVGGNENTQRLLPKLGWQQLAPLARYVRPLRLGAGIKELSRRLHFPLSAFPASLAEAFSLRVATMHGAEPMGDLSVIELQPEDMLPEIKPSSASSQLCTLLTAEEATWLHKAPKEMGELVVLAFSVDGVPAAISLSRLHWERPFRTANLLHLQAVADTPELYSWVITETSRRLADRGAHWVTTRFNSPVAQYSCERAGFRKMPASINSYWYDRNQSLADQALHLTWVCGDESLHPLPI